VIGAVLLKLSKHGPITFAPLEQQSECRLRHRNVQKAYSAGHQGRDEEGYDFYLSSEMAKREVSEEDKESVLEKVGRLRRGESCGQS